jgi:hypothetical protein
MESEHLHAVLQGNVLGPQSTSALQVLTREANELRASVDDMCQRASTTDASVVQSIATSLVTTEQRWGELTENAKDCRLGGSCRHGADQGPNCRRCMETAGALQGPYVKCADGLVRSIFECLSWGL